MSLKEIVVDIVIPLIAGFIGGSIGSVVMIKNKFNSIGLINVDKEKLIIKHIVQKCKRGQ